MHVLLFHWIISPNWLTFLRIIDTGKSILNYIVIMGEIAYRTVLATKTKLAQLGSQA